nr:hypothetical protein Iba_chr06fCG8390 [Ipomoea batatas]
MRAIIKQAPQSSALYCDLQDLNSAHSLPALDTATQLLPGCFCAALAQASSPELRRPLRNSPAVDISLFRAPWLEPCGPFTTLLAQRISRRRYIGDRRIVREVRPRHLPTHQPRRPRRRPRRVRRRSHLAMADRRSRNSQWVLSVVKMPEREKRMEDMLATGVALLDKITIV